MMSKKQKIILKHFANSLLFLIIVAADQVSKYFIRANLAQAESYRVTSFFSLTFLKNTGVSFGLFKGANWLFTLVAVAALALFIYYYAAEKKYRLQYAIIIAGITGNLIDRLFLGYVVDFFNFYYWPVFNIADSSIFVGIVWLFILLVKNKEDFF